MRENRAPDCSGCLLTRACHSCEFFEAPHERAPANQRPSPAPFELERDLDGRFKIEPGERLGPGINVTWAADSHLPTLVYALHLAGSAGIGTGYSPFELTRPAQEATLFREAWADIYSPVPSRSPPTSYGHRRQPAALTPSD